MMYQQKAYAKVNLFLKITGTKGNYHEMVSRFLRVDNLYDTVRFEPKDIIDETFVLLGDFNCTIAQNTITKAYEALKKAVNNKALVDFFKAHKVVVDKNIPSFAGLGGGSSDAATFLRMCNTYLDLGLSVHTLADIGASVGADVPFFVYDVAAANVQGIGDIVTPIDEAPLDIITFTPNIACHTVAVFEEFRAHHFKTIDAKRIDELLGMPSTKAFTHMDIHTANDLYDAACTIYPNLKAQAPKGYKFSGSGSSFFTIKGLDNG